MPLSSFTRRAIGCFRRFINDDSEPSVRRASGLRTSAPALLGRREPQRATWLTPCRTAVRECPQGTVLPGSFLRGHVAADLGMAWPETFERVTRAYLADDLGLELEI